MDPTGRNRGVQEGDFCFFFMILFSYVLSLFCVGPIPSGKLAWVLFPCHVVLLLRLPSFVFNLAFWWQHLWRGLWNANSREKTHWNASAFFSHFHFMLVCTLACLYARTSACLPWPWYYFLPLISQWFRLLQNMSRFPTTSLFPSSRLLLSWEYSLELIKKKKREKNKEEEWIKNRQKKKRKLIKKRGYP